MRRQKLPKHNVIVLAAGKGTRMALPGTPEEELEPKAITPFLGTTLVESVLEAIKGSMVKATPIIVVGFKADQVMDRLVREKYNFVTQEPQLGTGHAVFLAVEAIRGSVFTLVLYSDMPLIGPDTINKIVGAHLAGHSVITMATFTVPGFDGVNAGFNQFGRVVEDNKGVVAAIVEAKDATADQMAIKKLNPGVFCFNTKWLTGNIGRLRPTNKQGEFYLTDLVGVAVGDGEVVISVDIPLQAAFGVNSREQLAYAESIARSRKKD